MAELAGWQVDCAVVPCGPGLRWFFWVFMVMVTAAGSLALVEWFGLQGLVWLLIGLAILAGCGLSRSGRARFKPRRVRVIPSCLRVLSAEGNRWLPAEIVGLTRHWAGITVLFETADASGGATTHRLTLWRDRIGAEPFRRLAIMLDWQVRSRI